MTREIRRAAAAVLVALGSVVTVLALLAGPAGAQTTTIPSTFPAGSTAINGSVSSGTGYAQNNSTASGDAIATNGSTASGCAEANLNATASGAPCPGPTTTRPTATTVPATAARLALTGSWTAPLLAMAALAVVMGWLMLVSSNRRRRITVS